MRYRYTHSRNTDVTSGLFVGIVITALAAVLTIFPPPPPEERKERSSTPLSLPGFHKRRRDEDEDEEPEEREDEENEEDDYYQVPDLLGQDFQLTPTQPSEQPSRPLPTGPTMKEFQSEDDFWAALIDAEEEEEMKTPKKQRFTKAQVTQSQLL